MIGCSGVLYLAGVPMTEIVSTMGVSERTIRRFLRRVGISANRRGDSGGRTKTTRGYILLCRRTKQDGRVERREHRLVMESMLGRPLTRREVVHHINGDRADNRRENLMLFSSAKEHRVFHVKQENNGGGNA